MAASFALQKRILIARCCAAVTRDECDFACDPGYSSSGRHVCGADGNFSGGFCEADPCTAGLRVEHSATSCSGATTDTCTYSCLPGYNVSGTHTCGTDVDWFG